MKNNIGFEKSENNLRCIDKCYKKGDTIINPFTLHFGKENFIDVCPISLLYSNEILDKNKGKNDKWIEENNYKQYSKCNNTNKKTEIKVNYFAPSLNISNKFFFKYIYNFIKIDDYIIYEKNKINIKEKTKERILNSIWHKFYKKEDIKSDIFINYYIDNFLNNISFDELKNLIKDFISKNEKIWNEKMNIHQSFLDYIKGNNK